VFHFDIANAITTNGTTQTESDHLRLLTKNASPQETVKIISLTGFFRFNTAGGGGFRFKTFATASSAGSSATPAPRHPSGPAASCTAFTGPTPGATPVVRMGVGAAQTGGTGGDVALEPNNAITLLPYAGANGNGDVVSIANGINVPGDYTLVFGEG
jgi:hypothetical protein